MNNQYDLQEPHYQEPDIPSKEELTEADRAMTAGIEPVLLEDSLEHFWGLQDPLERIALDVRQGPPKPQTLTREQQELFYKLPTPAPPEVTPDPPEVAPEKAEAEAEDEVAEEDVETSEQTEHEKEIEEQLPGAGDPQEELERLMVFQQMFQQVQQQRMLNEMMSKQRMQMNAVQRE